MERKDAILKQVSNSVKWSRQSPLQSVLLAGLVLFFVSHFVLLSPSSLEDDFGGMRVIHPRDLLGLLQNEPETLAVSQLPENTPPSYSLRDLRIASSHQRSPEFLLSARKSVSFQKDELTHFRDLEVTTADKMVILSKEALYRQKEHVIHFLGDVRVRLPGGAEILTETAELITRPTLHIRVPATVRVQGRHVKGRNRVTFSAYGLDYLADAPEHLRLLQRVEDKTRSARDLAILSDSADYAENLGRLAFTMSEKRPIQEQFVRLMEPAFELKARNLELDLSGEKELQTVRAEKDVWFEETTETGRKTSGTGGRGTYSVESGLVTLSEFPQLYQDRDTITGEIILFHRDSDTIEVRQSNASYGN